MALFPNKWWWSFLLVGGCSGDAEPDEAAGAAANQAAAIELLQEQAAQAMIGVLADPQSARYSAVRRGSGGAICGQVDAKEITGEYSGPRPFLVTPDRVAMISTDARIRYEDPNDPFPDLYLRWCATPEELRRLQPALSEAAANAAEAQPEAQAEPAAPLPFEVQPLPVPPLAAEPPPSIKAPPSPAPPPSAAPLRPPQPSQERRPPSEGEESFFNAVRRGGE